MPPRKKTVNLVTTMNMPGSKTGPEGEPASEPDFNGADPALFDHDGDGFPGGSLPHEELAPPNPGNAAVEAKPEEPVAEVPPRPEPVSKALSDGMVRVRITKAGHGQVHTGQRDPKTYKWNDEPTFPREVGLALEARHFGEILE